ncbi:MAG: glycoside hydrolase family 25 protein [Flavobacteriaceae bacterium]|nr:glycoside hydrolase family 25 protein [Flavobacteriaceae bacterium]
MNNLFRNIIAYKSTHPIRFIAILLLLFFSILLFVFIVKKIIYKRKHIIAIGSRIWNFVWKIGLTIFVMTLGVFLMIHVKSNPIKFENAYISSSKHIFGLDVSQYQSKINWAKVKTSKHPIKFVFIRSSMGKNGKDSEFQYNWKNAKKYNYIRGAYHYYRPNENSTKQFNNFSSIVHLSSGDFPPVLDIERKSVFGKKKLREGVLNWLKLAEAHYGIKPIIYTGQSFYEKNLKGYVDGYQLWIAAYSGKHKVKKIDWTFHQFTEKAVVLGIEGKVDGNDFNGTMTELKSLCLD